MLDVDMLKPKNSGNQVTLVVFKDQKEGKTKDVMSKKRSTSGMIKKISSRGVPIRKVEGRLMNLRTINTHESGLVQQNLPSAQSTLQNSQLAHSPIPKKERKARLNSKEMSQQTSKVHIKNEA